MTAGHDTHTTAVLDVEATIDRLDDHHREALALLRQQVMTMDRAGRPKHGDDAQGLVRVIGREDITCRMTITVIRPNRRGYGPGVEVFGGTVENIIQDIHGVCAVTFTHEHTRMRSITDQDLVLLVDQGFITGDLVEAEVVDQ
ncbi:hypothetical protein [Nesterenkonia suensis]